MPVEILNKQCWTQPLTLAEKKIVAKITAVTSGRLFEISKKKSLKNLVLMDCFEPIFDKN